MNLRDRLVRKKEDDKLLSHFMTFTAIFCGVGLPLAFFLWVLSVAIRLGKL
ncbi:MAG: hypothetical protein II954_04200 [Synergistaceae bacterium]|nr:hypothetical protein [Synergistaceae bacterium]